MFIAKFEHIATGYPHGVAIPFHMFLLAKLGFVDLVLDWVTSTFGITLEDFFFEGVVKS